MECLPHHILVEILANLDTASLVTACKVCQLWSELIKTSQLTMNLVCVSVTSNRSRQTITIVDQLPCGRHRNLQIVDFCSDFVIIKQLLSMHRMTLENIRIVRPAMWHASMFTETFGALRNLRCLSLENCQFEMCTADVGGESECFERLRALSVVNCNCEIFSLFERAKNLETLNVEYSQTFASPSNATMKSLTKFLKNCRYLERLSLSGVTKFQENPFSDDEKFTFKLLRLKIDDFGGKNVSLSSVMKFLESQRRSLKFLGIVKQPCDEILNLMKSELNLKSNFKSCSSV